MKFSASQILASAALAGLANATFNCATDLEGIASVLSCVELLTTTITELASISSWECSYFRAAISCQSSICGDTYPTTADGNFAVETSKYCGVSGATATATAAAAASATAAGSESSAKGSAASGTSAAGARAMITAFPDQAVFLAAAGLVGALL